MAEIEKTKSGIGKLSTESTAAVLQKSAQSLFDANTLITTQELLTELKMIAKQQLLTELKILEKLDEISEKLGDK